TSAQKPVAAILELSSKTVSGWSFWYSAISLGPSSSPMVAEPLMTTLPPWARKGCSEQPGRARLSASIARRRIGLCIFIMRLLALMLFFISFREFHGQRSLDLDGADIAPVAGRGVRHAEVIKRSGQTALIGRRAAEVLAGVDGGAAG